MKSIVDKSHILKLLVLSFILSFCISISARANDGVTITGGSFTTTPAYQDLPEVQHWTLNINYNGMQYEFKFDWTKGTQFDASMAEPKNRLKLMQLLTNFTLETGELLDDRMIQHYTNSLGTAFENKRDEINQNLAAGQGAGSGELWYTEVTLSAAEWESTDQGNNYNRLWSLVLNKLPSSGPSFRCNYSDNKAAGDYIKSAPQSAPGTIEIENLAASLGGKAVVYDADGSGNSFKVPVYMLVPNWKDKNGGTISFQSYMSEVTGSWPISTDPASARATATNWLNTKNSKSTDMSNMYNTTIDGLSFSGKYVVACKPSADSLEGKFTVVASPKKKAVMGPWLTTEVVEYNVYLKPTIKSIQNEVGLFNITITTADAGGDVAGTFVAASVNGAETVGPVQMLGDKVSFDVDKKNLKKFNAQGTGTGGRAYVSVQYKVPGNGTYRTEQKQYASFEVQSVSAHSGTKVWTGIKNNTDPDFDGSKTYGSFIPGDEPVVQSGTLIHKDWELHTVGSPSCAGMMTANEYGSEDWEATVAIPSTENVSAVLGAETSMIDLNGYITATRDGSAGAFGGGKNQVWTSAPNAKVNRTIKITSKVSNIWGKYNSLDILTLASATASGGIATGSCPHSGSVSAFGPGSFQQMMVPACPGGIACGFHQWQRCGNSATMIQAQGGEEPVEGANGSVTMVPTGESDSRSPCSHDCTWFFAAYSGVAGVNCDIKTMGGKSTLQGCTVAWEGTRPGGYTFKSGNQIICTGGAWNGTTWQQLVSGRSAGDFTGVVRGSITYTPIANQYWMVSGSVSHTTPNGTEGVSFSPSIGSGQPLSKGYTQGTGTNVHAYENMVHQASHTNTLTYVESIDNYVYRRITNAVVYSLMGSELANIHQIGFDGGPVSQTQGAPISDAANGQKVTAPDMFGCLWRGLNSTAGQYESGSGRIVFEAWKSTGGKFGVSTSVTPEYFLGDAEITFNIVSDHHFGEACLATGNLGVGDITNIGGENKKDVGHTENRNHSSWISSSCDEWRDIQVGDCTVLSFNSDTQYEKGSGNTEVDYLDQIAAMQRAVANEWQFRNFAEDYHANVVSDAFAYGNMENTTIVRGDIYGVDEGIPLFNYWMGYGTGNQIDGNQTVYRNHVSAHGSTGEALIAAMQGGTMSVASINDGSPMPYFGYSENGMNSFDGGDQAFASSLVGALYAGNLTQYAGGGPLVSLSKGEGVASSAYVSKVDPSASYGSHSGSTTIVGDSGECGGEGFFAGYWSDHTYEGQHGATLSAKVNDDLAVASYGGTNCGTHNLATYGASMCISNIPLNMYTPNGEWDTCDAKFTYTETLGATTSGGEYGTAKAPAVLVQTVRSDSHKAIAENGISTALTPIYIYNPISTEFSQVIGDEYGNWSGNASKTPDESIYDQRVDSEGVPKNEIDPYTTPTRRTSVWITPIGDMNLVDNTGMSTGANGSSSVDGTIYRNQGIKGYSKNMNIEQWVQNWGVKYPFVNKFGSGVADNKNQYYDSNSLDRVYGGWTYGPSALQNFKESPRDHEFKYGDCFYGKTTPYTDEMQDGVISILAQAINCYVKTGDGSASYGFTEPSKYRNNRATNTCVTDIEVDVVGVIGNLAIHDTTDFRFSNFFKKATDEWLIPGTVKKVDSTIPEKIVATTKDILEFNVERDSTSRDNKRTHSTYGTTDYSVELDDGSYEHGYGMAGPYETLPLVPAYNTVKEYKSEALRLGYKTLCSIETIGSYQATLPEGTIYPVSTAEERDASKDTRTEYLEIKSHYYLYDFDDGKFYQIDLWSGGSGLKTRIYNGKTDEVELSKNSEGLYVNMDDESERRNLGLSEQGLTMANQNDTFSPTSLTVGEDYIGYTGYLKLDNRNLTFIGSDCVFGDSYSTIIDTASQAGNKAQRWHFTQGLTSSTSASYHVDSTDQAVIEAASKKLKEEHPHAVIVEFNDYIAHGSIWTIRHLGSLYHNPVIKFYSDIADERPEWITASSKTSTTYQGANVYERGGVTVAYTIDKELSPLCTYEAYRTAAEDRAVSGTH